MPLLGTVLAFASIPAGLALFAVVRIRSGRDVAGLFAVMLATAMAFVTFPVTFALVEELGVPGLAGAHTLSYGMTAAVYVGVNAGFLTWRRPARPSGMIAAAICVAIPSAVVLLFIGLVMGYAVGRSL